MPWSRLLFFDESQCRDETLESDIRWIYGLQALHIHTLTTRVLENDEFGAVPVQSTYIRSMLGKASSNILWKSSPSRHACIRPKTLQNW